MRGILILTLVALLALPACKNNHVVHSTLGIQKRKYTKGYHLNLGARKKLNIQAKDITQLVTEVHADRAPAPQVETLLASLEQTPPHMAQLTPKSAEAVPSFSKPGRKHERVSRKERIGKAGYVMPDDDKPLSDWRAHRALKVVLYGLFIWPVMIPGFIMALDAVHKIKKYPKKYAGYKYARRALIIASIHLTLLLMLGVLALQAVLAL